MMNASSLLGSPPYPSSQRGGFALITVILVLAMLLLLCTPFLLTARNADQASQQLFHRAEARIALDNASTHARAKLEQSHPSLDLSLYADSLYELEVGNEFAEGFLDARDAQGVMWDVVCSDVSGQIDISSAPPQVIAAMMGSVTRLIAPQLNDDDEVPVASVEGLDPSGYIWVGGELVKYSGIQGNKLVGVVRGVGARYDADDKALPGPLPPVGHGVGTTVMDQRAFAPVEWRMFDGDVRDFDSYEQLEEVNQFAAEENQLTPEHIESLTQLGSVFGGVGAGGRWQRAARMVSGGERDLTGKIRVDSVRWFNSGSTILITDGVISELAVVRNVTRNGVIELDRGLSASYDAYDAEVRVLARRPVNINTATPEVIEILLKNLKLRGRNQRITGSEARALTEIIVESRPFEGLEDFLLRVVLPSAGIEALPGDASVVPDVFGADSSRTASVIDHYDALALYRNALNANDFQLEYSTMPFSFTSNNVYDLTERAVINAASGVERYSAIREETHVVIPQQELLHVWGTQEDYDMMLRLKREAPYWMTGPEPTSRHDHGNTHPPTRLWAHMGTLEGKLYLPSFAGSAPISDPEDQPNVEHVFADRDPDGFVQLMHLTVDSQADPEMANRVMHFTHETRSLEGRYLPNETIVQATDDQRVQWDVKGGIGLLRGLHFSFWVKPMAHDESVLLDVGGSSQEADRLTILFEEGDLVLRAFDAGGDHRDSNGNPALAAFKEVSEVRYSLGVTEDSSGLPLDTWSHIEIDFRGTRPDQMMMLVNGLAQGVRTPGMTRLSTAVGEFDSMLPVDSVEGFPPMGVVRIGHELIEYRLNGDALEAVYIEAGPDAGFGGRNARGAWMSGDAAGVSEPPGHPQPYFPNLLNHPQGATVELYGFAHSLASDVPSGEATLPEALGTFRVGIVKGVIGGPTLGEQITVPVGIGFVPVGTGIHARDTSITDLILTSAETPDDQNADVDLVMEAFNKNGGYALLMQGRLAEPTLDGDPVGGWSVIRYSGWDDEMLHIAAWGTEVSELKNLQNLTQEQANIGGGARAFVVAWTAYFAGNPTPIQDLHQWRLFIIPISLSVAGASHSFLPADKDDPQFAQVTELSANENTEWVCYNEIVSGATQQLVRDDPRALERALGAATGPLRQRDVADPEPPEGPGSMFEMAEPEPPGPPFAGPVAPPAPSAPLLDSVWQPILGEPEDLEPAPDGYPITRAVREVFQFRGVMGTYPHDHLQGVPIRPVFKLEGGDLEVGAPGRNDPVFLFEADPNHLGWPTTISRAYRPANQLIVYHPWVVGDPSEIVSHAAEVNTTRIFEGFQPELWYASLNGPAPAPVSASVVEGGAEYNLVDSRMLARMTRFPSGERPREATSVSVGGEVSGGRIPAAFVDEIIFGATDFGLSAAGADGESIQASQFVMRGGLPDSNGEEILHVGPGSVRIPKATFNSSHNFLGDLDQDGGLLRLGNEIMAYESLDLEQGEITIAENGRALMGTERGEHEVGSTVTFLDGFRVAILSASIGAGDAAIPVTSTDDFPFEGTLLIDGELIHYTRLRRGSFEMPSSSSEPGRMDQKGSGIFRGRYGTEPQGHTVGSPVIFFPIRYWDRWTPLADGPELSYFGLELSQPAAFWRSFSWQEMPPAHPGVRLGVLVRSDRSIPWDSDPEITEGLAVYYRGEDETSQQFIATQSDGVDWRIFAEYTPEAFGVFGQESWGRGHGWRTTPSLTNFMVEYVGPAMTLRSVER